MRIIDPAAAQIPRASPLRKLAIAIIALFRGRPLSTFATFADACGAQWSAREPAVRGDVRAIECREV